MRNELIRAACLLALSAPVITGIGGCKSSNGGSATSHTAAPAEKKSLYDRLGGEQAITAVVDDFVARAAADPKVNFTRKGHPNAWDPTPANVEKLKKHLVQFVAHATGGPQAYHGKAMKPVHTGMEISEAEWNASVADLKATLDQFNVPAAEQKELIAIVATTHDDIVGQ